LVTAHVTPLTSEVQAGTVRFDLDGSEVVASAAIDADGVATATIGPLGDGSHEVVAHYDPPAATDIDPSDSSPISVEALHGATMSWHHAPSRRHEGEPSWVNVTLDTSATPTAATLAVRDLTTDTVFASTAVTSTHTFLSQSFSPALGTHDLRVELTGDATFVPAALEATLEVVPDTEVN